MTSRDFVLMAPSPYAGHAAFHAGNDTSPYALQRPWRGRVPALPVVSMEYREVQYTLRKDGLDGWQWAEQAIVGFSVDSRRLPCPLVLVRQMMISATLKTLARKKPPADIAAALGRSVGATSVKAHQLKVSLKMPRRGQLDSHAEPASLAEYHPD
jgi:hypothetical protein